MTISIINGTIIKDGKLVVPAECRMGLRVENAFEYFSKNKINLDLTKHEKFVALTMNHYVGKQKLIKALIEDKVIKAHQLVGA